MEPVDMSDDSEESSVEITDLSNPEVVNKYKTSAEIANKAMELVISEILEMEKSIRQICLIGDDFIKAQVQKQFVKRDFPKGVAFPTCITPNHIIANLSPREEDDFSLSPGDIVKIDLGVHFDGFASFCAHTIILPSGKESIPPPIISRKADAIAACHLAYQGAMRCIYPGRTNTEVTAVLKACARNYGCNLLQGTSSNELDRFQIESDNVIEGNLDRNQFGRVEEFEFEPNTVYCLDIIISTSDGDHINESDYTPSIYRRDTCVMYSLRRKSSRALLKEATTRFNSFPFKIEDIENKSSLIGLSECMEHELILPYPILKDKNNGYIAQLKSTLLLLPTGTISLNPLRGTSPSLKPFEMVNVSASERIYVNPMIPANVKEVTEENIVKLLSSPIPGRKKSKKRRNKAGMSSK